MVTYPESIEELDFNGLAIWQKPNVLNHTCGIVVEHERTREGEE
jgi:hypothetical protein